MDKSKKQENAGKMVEFMDIIFTQTGFFNVQVYRIKLSETFICTEYLMMVLYSILFLQDINLDFETLMSKSQDVELLIYQSDEMTIVPFKIRFDLMLVIS